MFGLEKLPIGGFVQSAIDLASKRRIERHRLINELVKYVHEQTEDARSAEDLEIQLTQLAIFFFDRISESIGVPAAVPSVFKQTPLHLYPLKNLFMEVEKRISEFSRSEKEKEYLIFSFFVDQLIPSIMARVYTSLRNEERADPEKIFGRLD